MPNTAIVGGGNIGGALARSLGSIGRDVVVGVRDPAAERAVELTRQPGVRVATVSEALAGAGVVVLAIPGRAVDAFAREHGGALGGAVAVDATNNVGGGGPLNGRPALLDAAPGLAYARAFNTVGWEVIAEPVIDGVAADLLWCGDDAATTAVESLISDVGLNPVRVGGIDQLDLVDNLPRLWFALALTNGMGRHLALKVLRET